MDIRFLLISDLAWRSCFLLYSIWFYFTPCWLLGALDFLQLMNSGNKTLNEDIMWTLDLKQDRDHKRYENLVQGLIVILKYLKQNSFTSRWILSAVHKHKVHIMFLRTLLNSYRI